MTPTARIPLGGLVGAMALAFALTPFDDAKALQVNLTDTAGTVSIFDNALGDDGDLALGIIDYDSSTATTVPGAWAHISFQSEICTTNCPTMDLSVQADDRSAGTITVEASHSGFILPTTGTGFSALFLPSTTLIEPGMSVKMQAFWDPGNVLFAKTFQIDNDFTLSGTNADGAVLSDFFPSGSTASPFSMTLVYEITHGGGFDEQSLLEGQVRMSAAVPAPAALPLLGLGMATIVAAARRRRRRS